MKGKLKALFLTLNTFDTTGGIQKVCRTLSHSLEAIFGHAFRMLCLYDDQADERYVSNRSFTGFKGAKTLFFINAAIKGANSSIIILSHINLISVALLIRIFNRKSKIVMLAHGTEVWRNLPLWKKKFIQTQVHVWSVSGYTKRILNDRHQICAFSSIINNCLDPFFKPPVNFDKPGYLLKRYGLPAGKPVLLTICRLNEHEHFKGYDRVIILMKRLIYDYPDLHYLLCGQANQREFNRLRHLITESNLDHHVSLPGFIHEKELTDHYLLADVFVLPSQKEGFGLVLTEAAVCGCCVVCGNSDGSPEAILDGKLGTMVNPSDPEALYDAICQNLNLQTNSQVKKSLQALTLRHFGYPQYQRKIKHMLFP